MKVLIIEDEHRIAQVIQKGLRQEQYSVEVAYDGEVGYDLASSEEYDVILLDRMLPGIDGIDICKKLRTESIHTPIIMLTAKTQVKDTIDGLTAGADDYIAKPFSFEELVARIQAVTRRPKRAVSTKLRIADLELDTKQLTVVRSGQQIVLSHKEFLLLEYLLRHVNQVVTKNQIISYVWNYDADILPNTIEVYIKNLRRKIDTPFASLPPLIHTHRGFGYMLREPQ